MSTRAALHHIAKIIRDQQVAPVSFDQPHFLFDSTNDLPSFGDHQLCVTAYEGHLSDMKLAEWGCAPVASSLAGIDLTGLSLEE